MASSARIFFAGVGTTFDSSALALAAGSSWPKSALKEPTGYQAVQRRNRRHLLNSSFLLPAEAAEPPQPLQQVAATEPAPEPVKEREAC